MLKTSIETKVGILFFITLIIIGIFVYLLGIFNPFTPTYKLNVKFNYAGGLSVGSPVRVAGVRVGRVSDIEFITSDASKDLQILVTLLIKKSVQESIKDDSIFFINMSGLIGEKYIEIKPGKSENFSEPGTTLVGIDPPRIDQLISQSYDLFSKLETLIMNNKGNLTKILSIIENLSASLNQIFESTSEEDSRNIRKILSNIQKITTDMMLVSSETKSSLIPFLLDLEPTMKNLKIASENLSKFSQFVSSLNQKDKENFESAVKNIALITEKIDLILKDIPSLKLDEFKEIFSKTGVKVKIF